VLTPEKREYYALEELWGDAPEVALKLDSPAPEPKPRVKKVAVKKTPAKKAATKRAPRKK